MFWFWTSQLHAFVFPVRGLGCRKSSASTGVIQIKVLTTLSLKFQVSMVKIKNPNWTIRKDIDFVFFGKFVISTEGSTRTLNFLRLNRNSLILQILILICGCINKTISFLIACFRFLIYASENLNQCSQ